MTWRPFPLRATPRVLAILLALVPAPVRAAPDTVLGASANAAYLADSAKRPGTVMRASGLQYRVLHPGFGRRVGGNDIVHLQFSIRLIDGTLVESTNPSLPVALAVNAVAFAGLSEALVLMHVGDRWQIVVPSNLGFGDSAAKGGSIPPGQTLIIDLTVLSAATPQPGEVAAPSPFSVWGNSREGGASFTIHP